MSSGSIAERLFLEPNTVSEDAQMARELDSTTRVPDPVGQLFLRVERALLLATVVLLPLAYAPGILLDFFNMPKLTVLFIIAPLAVALRLAAAALGAPSKGLRLLALPASAMSLALITSWLLSDYRSWSLLGLYGRYGGLLPYLAVILFAVLLADAFAGTPRPVLYALVGGGAGVGLYALIQMLFLGGQVGQESQTAYITSTLGHSNFAGGYLAIMLPLSIGLWVQPGRLSRWGMAATILIASGLLFTVSQGAWLAGIGGTGLLAGLLASNRHRWARPAGGLIAVGAAMASAGVVALSVAIPHAYARLPDYLATAVSRGFLWESAFAAAADKPVFGHGPNVYAIVGPLHRTVEDALLNSYSVKGDDPHSVPLAMLANLGLFGLLAFIFLFVWVASKWRSIESPSAMQNAVLAALVTYAIQALVSIDELALRFSFWVLLAAVACFAVKEQGPEERSARRLGVWTARSAIVAGLVAAATATAVLPIADYKAGLATEHFSAGSVAKGQAKFLEALALRNDNEYRQRYGGALGNAALAGYGGAGLINGMREVFSYLDSFPDAQALAYYGRLLNNWSANAPEANEEALDVFTRAMKLDPHNPLLAVDLADSLVQEGRPAEAEENLEPFERLLTARYPEFSPLYSDLWSSLAIARASLGHLHEARATLSKATDSDSCRYLIAMELLKPRHEQERSLGGALFCPESLLQLLPEQAEEATAGST